MGAFFLCILFIKKIKTMLDIFYEGYGFDTIEQFVPLAIQCNTQFDGEKVAKEKIEYTEVGSFISEDYPKEDDLFIPLGSCEKSSGKIIDDADVDHKTV